jgi:hypothetical protein
MRRLTDTIIVLFVGFEVLTAVTMALLACDTV